MAGVGFGDGEFFEGCVMGAVDKCMGIDGFGGMGV